MKTSILGNGVGILLAAVVGLHLERWSQCTQAGGLGGLPRVLWAESRRGSTAELARVLKAPASPATSSPGFERNWAVRSIASGPISAACSGLTSSAA